MFTKPPFVVRAAGICAPKLAVNRGLLDEPASEVDSVGFESCPVDILRTALGDGELPKRLEYIPRQ